MIFREKQCASIKNENTRHLSSEVLQQNLYLHIDRYLQCYVGDFIWQKQPNISSSLFGHTDKQGRSKQGQENNISMGYTKEQRNSETYLNRRYGEIPNSYHTSASIYGIHYQYNEVMLIF